MLAKPASLLCDSELLLVLESSLANSLTHPLFLLILQGQTIPRCVLLMLPSSWLLRRRGGPSPRGEPAQTITRTAPQLLFEELPRANKLPDTRMAQRVLLVRLQISLRILSKSPQADLQLDTKGLLRT
jgi:hypothetical protein